MDEKRRNQDRLIDVYRRQASHYDASGIHGLEPWREEAVRRLNLERGSLVVDIGCGTGLNFALLQEAVGTEGRVIGVDLTDAMLDQARKRVEQHGWQNVALVQSDAAQYVFPPFIDGIISTFALTFVPDCGRVIQNGCEALAPGRKCVVLDMHGRIGCHCGCGTGSSFCVRGVSLEMSSSGVHTKRFGRQCLSI